MRVAIVVAFALAVVFTYAAISGFEYRSGGNVKENFGENWSR